MIILARWRRGAAAADNSWHTDDVAGAERSLSRRYSAFRTKAFPLQTETGNSASEPCESGLILIKY